MTINEADRHHVVGPVHVLTLGHDDANDIATALEQERDDCHAARVIIDITGFDGSMSIILEGAEKTGWGRDHWDQDIMVRTADQRHLTLDELENEANQIAT